MMKLINARPSPFGRKVAIAMLEKGIPFEVQWDIPWHADTAVPAFNPLEQLPILVTLDGETIYESSYILEWLEHHFPEPPLLPASPEQRLRVNFFRVLAVGVMDAIVRINFELARPEPCQSTNWIARQTRKISGGIAEIGRQIDGRRFAVGESLSLADLEVGSVLGHLDFLIDAIPVLGVVLKLEAGWRSLHPCLDDYVAGLESRASFKAARREMVEIDFGSVIGRA